MDVIRIPVEDRTVRQHKTLEGVLAAIAKGKYKYLVRSDRTQYRDGAVVTDEKKTTLTRPTDHPKISSRVVVMPECVSLLTPSQKAVVRHVLPHYVQDPDLCPYLSEILRVHDFPLDTKDLVFGELVEFVPPCLLDMHSDEEIIDGNDPF